MHWHSKMFQCDLPNFPSSTMKQTRIDYFVRPTRDSRFCIPPKTNYSSLLIMGNVGQLRAAETRSTASERNGGGAAGKVRRRRMRRSAPALCIAPLPPPLFLQHQYRVRNRIRVLESERAAGHHCTATEDTPSQNQEQGKGKKRREIVQRGRTGRSFFWNHRNLWEIKQEPDICQ